MYSAFEGKISINIELIKAPKECIDYVITHELCHLKEFNHSRAFWDLVGQALPDYADSRKYLRRKGIRVC